MEGKSKEYNLRFYLFIWSLSSIIIVCCHHHLLILFIHSFFFIYSVYIYLFIYLFFVTTSPLNCPHDAAISDIGAPVQITHPVQRRWTGVNGKVVHGESLLGRGREKKKTPKKVRWKLIRRTDMVWSGEEGKKKLENGQIQACCWARVLAAGGLSIK